MKEKERYATYAISSLTTYHYKVLFLLMSEEQTQSQLCEKLGVKKQNVHKICKELKSMDFIQESKRIGNNIYFEVNKDPCVQLKGQINNFDLLKQ